MNMVIRVPLAADAAQRQRLAALQNAFANVCNTLAPVVQQSRCWNRVALHHMSYRQLRSEFPQLGSQMICNAIYSVSRACRQVYQHPSSPFNLALQGDKPLPLLRFQPSSPVFFDRHTLSIRSGQLSMFTLDGRLHFALAVPPDVEARFRTDKLREVVLKQQSGDFVLDFAFAADHAEPADAGSDDLPEYVLVTEDPAPPPRATDNAVHP